MNLKPRLFSLLSAALFLAAALPAARAGAADDASSLTPVTASDELKPMLTNNRLTLLCNSETGNIAVRDLSGKALYTASPTDAGSNPNLKGVNRTAALSQIVLRLADKQGNELLINSLVESVNRGGLTVYQGLDSVKLVYAFPNYGIDLAVLYTLEDNRLVVRIPVEEIRSPDTDMVLREIRLLPYFGAASAKDEGYFVVPDGSGSLIRFHSKRTPAYAQTLYGTDRGKTVSLMPASEQPALLPAIAAGYESYSGTSGGVLSYVESGASLATAYASAEAADGCYNTACFGFTYRAYDQVTLMDRTSSASTVVMNEKAAVGCDEFRVSYTFLSDAGLIGLAAAARERVYAGQEIPRAEDQETPVYIKAYMSVRKTKYFLGIPYQGNQKLTDLDNCREMLESFGGLPVVFSLAGLDKDGAVGGSIDNRLKVQRAVGSVRELRRFIAEAESTGGGAYPVAEFTEFTKGNLNGRVLSVSNLPVRQYFFDYGTRQIKEAYPGLYLLKNDRITNYVKSWLDSSAAQDIQTCAPLTLSNAPYRSGGETGFDRDGTQRVFGQALQTIKDHNVRMLLDMAAAFAVPYAERIQSLPVSSSGFAAESTEVPFLQMVLHGAVSYGMPAVNLSGDMDRAFLKAIETGSSMSFAFTGSAYDRLKETPLDRLNGADFSLWKAEASSKAAALAEVMRGTTAAYITDYRLLSDEVRAVSYGNGSSFLINYGNEPFEYNGVSVPAMSYRTIDREVLQ